MVQYRDLGDSVLTIADVEAVARGLPVEMKSFQVWAVRDGKVSAMRAFLSEQQALNAVGLEK
jgi:ketosteroid isomerase-like protein